MKVYIDVGFNVDNVLAAKGMGSSNLVKLYIASEVRRLCEPYVPFQTGNLAHRSSSVSSNGDVVYSAPHAHYQYEGQVMGGKAPKHYTGAAISYHGTPLRGAHWEKRMMADKGKELCDSVKKYVANLGG